MKGGDPPTQGPPQAGAAKDHGGVVGVGQALRLDDGDEGVH